MPLQNKQPFSFTVPGQIWKITADTSNNLLVAEVRVPEERKVYFIGLDLNTTKKIWEFTNQSEEWWTGLSSASNNRTFLYTYKDPQFPEPSGILVLDSKSGKLLWKDEAASLLASDPAFLIVSKGEQEHRKFLKLDVNTGKELGELDGLKVIKEVRELKNRPQDIQNPYHFSFDNPNFQKVAEYLKEAKLGNPELGLDYFETENLVLISFYVKAADEKLNNILAVIDDEGTVIFQEKLAEGLSGIGMDTFFLLKNRLIFVKDKNQLIILDL